MVHYAEVTGNLGLRVLGADAGLFVRRESSHSLGWKVLR